jgi:hypothetical protein
MTLQKYFCGNFFLNAIAIPDDPVPVIWRMPSILVSWKSAKTAGIGQWILSPIPH